MTLKDENTVLEEIEDTNKELLSSNNDLADSLRKNHSVLESISAEIEALKSGESFDPALKKRVKSLRGELEKKRSLISNMIDSIEPIESDIDKNSEIVDVLKQRVEDQGCKIESLSKDVLDHRKSMQKLSEINNVLNDKLVEKESIVEILKTRLKEKTEILRSVDEKKRSLEYEVDSSKKKIFALENKIGSIEKRIFAGDERNQQLIYELIKNKELIKELQGVVASKDALVENKTVDFQNAIEATQLEHEEKRRMIMEAHSKKVAVLNAQLVNIKASLEQQKRLVDSRIKKERSLMSDFSERMRSLMTSDQDINNMIIPETPIFKDTSQNIDNSNSIDSLNKLNNNLSNNNNSLNNDLSDNDNSLNLSENTLNNSNNETRINEILPVVEMALDRGDSPDSITDSLISSGYSKKEVHAALNALQNISEE